VMSLGQEIQSAVNAAAGSLNPGTCLSYQLGE